MIRKSKIDIINKLVKDFVFIDCRLADHPKVRTNVFLYEPLLSKPGKLTLVPLISSRERRRFYAEFDVSDHGRSIITEIITEIFNKQAYVVTSGLDEINIIQSFLAAPIAGFGVLTFDSKSKNFFAEKHLGLAQLLAALIAYVKGQLEFDTKLISPTSVSLGKALREVREEIGLTQLQLATKMGRNRITISRWESGTQPPSQGPLYEWCQALGILSRENNAIVHFVDVSQKLLRLLKEQPDRLRELSPSQFELLVAERLDRMGYDVTLTGNTSQRDGGIDMIAIPKIRTVGAFLLAGQIKHHRGVQKTGREAVDRLLAWQNSYFRLGLLVTNTGFTRDARWAAMQQANRFFIRLRDFGDLERWLEDNFSSEEDWLEIPEVVELAPGIIIKIPKPRLRKSLDIWPLSKFNINNLK